MRYLLGLDNGGTTTKAAIYDLYGKEICVSSTETKMLTPLPDFVERDMEEMWNANCMVIREAIHKSGIGPEEISAVAVCGHGKGLYLIDANGKPVRNGIISTDNRSWAYREKWMQDGTADKVYQYTCQQIMACQPVALLAWLRDHEPDSLERACYLLPAKDYVRFRLTGEISAELSDMSGTNLVNLWTRNYDDRILKLFGIEDCKRLLPPLIDSPVKIGGYITEVAAEATGLKIGTPVAAGLWDMDACMLSTGVLDESYISMIAGTWNINIYLNRKPVIDHSAMMNSCFSVPGHYMVEESSPTSAGANAWFIRTFLQKEKDELKAQGDSIYDEMNQWVEEIPPQKFCPIFLPYVLGSNVHPNAKGCFIGMNASHNLKHIVRGVYEGIAFTHRTHLLNLMKSYPGTPKAIRLAGGVTHSPVWAQMFADVMGMNIETVGTEETGAQGCAIAASVTGKIYGSLSEAVDHMFQKGKTYFPNMKNHQIYLKKYQLYEGAIRSLDHIWDSYQQYIDEYNL